LSFSLLFVCQ